MFFKCLKLFVLLLFFGCSTTTEPLSWKSEDLVIPPSVSFDIQTATASTETAMQPGTLAYFTSRLKEQFAAKSLRQNNGLEPEEQVLMVHSEIMEYKFSKAPPPPRNNAIAQCIVRTRLTQRPSSAIVAEIITVNKTYVGNGLLEPKIPEAVLVDSAKSIVQQIIKMMQQSNQAFNDTHPSSNNPSPGNY